MLTDVAIIIVCPFIKDIFTYITNQNYAALLSCIHPVFSIFKVSKSSCYSFLPKHSRQQQGFGVNLCKSTVLGSRLSKLVEVICGTSPGGYLFRSTECRTFTPPRKMWSKEVCCVRRQRPGRTTVQHVSPRSVSAGRRA